MDDLSGLPRRGFMMTGLIAGFTLATTRVEAQAIHTDTTGLEAGDTKIPVADGFLPAYFARPAGPGPFPVVIVVEEIFGVHEYIKDTCRRLAKLGYLAVSSELYAREGDLSTMTDVATIFREVISKAPDATMLSDLDATASWAGANHGDLSRFGVTGFCRGGRSVWMFAEHNPQLKAAVAWYGPVLSPTSPIQPTTATDHADGLLCPLLGLYGEKDPSIKVADVQAAAAKARAAGKSVEIVIYPNSAHAFHADYRPSYVKADAEDGWARMLAFFKKNGVA
jgi:carboxymethylenebutenolidase